MNAPQVITPTKQLVAVPPRAGGHIEAFVPRSIEEIKWIVGLLIEAKLAPDSFENDPKKITLAVLKGLEVGLPPLMAVSNIAIINGRASLWGDAALALVQSKNVIERMEVEEIGTKPGETAETAAFAPDYGYAVRIWRKGQTAPYAGKYTVGDAKRARLWMHPKKAPWMQSPKRMLKIRATAFPLRDGFADCLSGLAIAEEVQDIPQAIAAPDTSFLDDKVSPATPPAPPAEAGDAAGSPSISEAAPAATPSEPEQPDDWKQWADGVIEEINGAQPAGIPAMRDRLKGQLAKAPPAYQGQINRRLREKERAGIAA